MITQTPRLSHAAQLVHDFDHDRFITALFAPAAHRDALMALYAFNVEVSRIRELVREPMAGLVRLQWWRDALGAMEAGGTGDNHPVGGLLAPLISSKVLPLAEFERVLDTREQDLQPQGPADLVEAQAYAEGTSGALARLAARVLGCDDQGSLAAATHVGVAWALAGQARAVGFHLSIGRLTLPESVLRQAGSSGAEVASATAPPSAIIAAVRGMGELALDHLDRARGVDFDRRCMAALLPGVLASRYLDALGRKGWDPFAAGVAERKRHPFRLAWANWRGRL